MPLHTDEPKAKVCLGRSSAAERIKVRYHGTGAANHMTGHVDDFAEIDRTVTCIVKFCNSSILEIKGIDTSSLSLKTDNTMFSSASTTSPA
jgi:hypothetical protein